MFNPANQKLIDFLEELQKLARNVFGVAAQAIIEQLIYAEMPPHLKKSFNQAHLENVTYKQNASHFETELELNSLEAPNDLQISTATQQVRQQNSEKPKPTCHHCKKPGHDRNQCPQLKREEDQPQNHTNSADNNNNNIPTNSKANNTIIQKNRRPTLVHPPCETCGKTNQSTEKCHFGANAPNKLPPRNRRPEGQNQVLQRNAQSNSDGKTQPNN